jgi:hypothetical protein
MNVERRKTTPTSLKALIIAKIAMSTTVVQPAGPLSTKANVYGFD